MLWSDMVEGGWGGDWVVPWYIVQVWQGVVCLQESSRTCRQGVFVDVWWSVNLFSWDKGRRKCRRFEFEEAAACDRVWVGMRVWCQCDPNDPWSCCHCIIIVITISIHAYLSLVCCQSTTLPTVSPTLPWTWWRCPINTDGSLPLNLIFFPRKKNPRTVILRSARVLATARPSEGSGPSFFQPLRRSLMGKSSSFFGPMSVRWAVFWRNQF